MAGQDTLGEFLVSLSFAQNEAQQRKFVDSIETATTKAILMAKVIEEGAVKIGGAISDTAEKYSSLAFFAQSMQTSATDIKAFEEASERMLGKKGRETADSILRGIDLAYHNTTQRQQLAGIGVKSSNLWTASQELAKALKDNEHNLARTNEILGMANVGRDAQILLEKSKDLQETFAEIKKEQEASGITNERIAQVKEFWLTLSKIQSMGSNIMAGALMQVATGPLTGPLNSFEAWLEKNQTTITKDLTTIGDAFAHLVPTDYDTMFAVLQAGMWAVVVYVATLEASLKSVVELMTMLRTGRDPTMRPIAENPNDTGLAWLMQRFRRALGISKEEEINPGLRDQWKNLPAKGAGNSGLDMSGDDLAALTGGAFTVDGARISQGNPLPIKFDKGFMASMGAAGGVISAALGAANAVGRGLVAGLTTVGAGMSMYPGISNAQLKNEIERAFAKQHIDPKAAVALASTEGAFGHEYVGDKSIGGSFGAFQLHSPGLRDKFMADNPGLDPKDPNTRLAQLDWVAKFVAKRGSWGGDWATSMGKLGLDPRAGIGGNYDIPDAVLGGTPPGGGAPRKLSSNQTSTVIVNGRDPPADAIASNPAPIANAMNMYSAIPAWQ